MTLGSLGQYATVLLSITFRACPSGTGPRRRGAPQNKSGKKTCPTKRRAPEKNPA